MKLPFKRLRHAFGGYGLYENLPKNLLTPLSIGAALIVLAIAIFAAARLGASKQRRTLDDIAVCKKEERSDFNEES